MKVVIVLILESTEFSTPLTMKTNLLTCFVLANETMMRYTKICDENLKSAAHRRYRRFLIINQVIPNPAN